MLSERGWPAASAAGNRSLRGARRYVIFRRPSRCWLRQGDGGGAAYAACGAPAPAALGDAVATGRHAALLAYAFCSGRWRLPAPFLPCLLLAGASAANIARSKNGRLRRSLCWAAIPHYGFPWMALFTGGMGKHAAGLALRRVRLSLSWTCSQAALQDASACLSTCLLPLPLKLLLHCRLPGALRSAAHTISDLAGRSRASAWRTLTKGVAWSKTARFRESVENEARFPHFPLPLARALLPHASLQQHTYTATLRVKRAPRTLLAPLEGEAHRHAHTAARWPPLPPFRKTLPPTRTHLRFLHCCVPAALYRSGRGRVRDSEAALRSGPWDTLYNLHYVPYKDLVWQAAAASAAAGARWRRYAGARTRARCSTTARAARAAWRRTLLPSSSTT